MTHRELHALSSTNKYSTENLTEIEILCKTNLNFGGGGSQRLSWSFHPVVPD